MVPTFFGKKSHPQETTKFPSEPIQRQYGRRQVIGRITEPRTGVL
jgi:hypothetical protein